MAPAGSLTAHEHPILLAVNTTASSLSFIGSGFIVLCYALLTEIRKFSFKLVFFLSLSDMLCSFFSIVGHKTDVEDLEAMFHLYVWGTSFLMTVIQSIGNEDTHFGTWCWTRAGFEGKAIHFITFYLPLWGAIIYNGFRYFQVIRMLNNATRMAADMESNVKLDIKAMNRWGYYPLILIGSWAFGTINKTRDFIDPGHKIFWLSFLDVGTSALMGFFNSIGYGLNSSVRRAICERLELFFPERVPTSPSSGTQHQETELELIPLKIEDE